MTQGSLFIFERKNNLFMEQMSIVSLVTNASFAVQIIMLLLAVFSVISWGIIIGKYLSLTKAMRQTNAFISNYRNTNSLNSLFNSINKTERVTTAQMCYAGLTEYQRATKSGCSKQDVNTNIERALLATIEEEIDNYESGLSTLATFGSVSPYIGLLGTVWGIMHAFIGLGNGDQATLASVAPGIAEALIATAIGLFVAIPAYMGFNKFTADVAKLEKKMNAFGDDFLNMLNRQTNANSHQDL